MKALEIFIIALAILGLATFVILFYLFISNVVDEIKRLIRNLRRKCPICGEKVSEKDLYCRHCGRALFKEMEE